MKKAIKGVKTIEQYKIMEYIYENFEPNIISCELINHSCVKVTDTKQDSLYFHYQDEQVLSSDVPIDEPQQRAIKKVKTLLPKSP